MVKNLLANAGALRLGSVSGLGRSPGVENGNPLQHSCVGNPMDRGAWQATVHGVIKSRALLSVCTAVSACMRARVHTHKHTHIKTVEMCSLVILRTEISNQNVGRAALPPGELEKNFSFASSSSGSLLAFYDL